MCGRYTIAIQAHEAAEELRAVLTIDAIPERYNLAPTDDAPIALVTQSERRIGLARFGLVPTTSDGPKAVGARYINLRAEGLTRQEQFAVSAARRRCLVLASGFYEWKREGTKKEPWLIHAEGGDLITFAGIWDVWRAEDHTVPSFAILTTGPSALMRELHDRMPLIVPPAMRDAWLDPDESDVKKVLAAVRSAPPIALEAHRVSTRVGNVRNDDPTLVEPIDDERRRG
jgi:putative SOS response-associated peptidase YedK